MLSEAQARICTLTTKQLPSAQIWSLPLSEVSHRSYPRGDNGPKDKGYFLPNWEMRKVYSSLFLSSAPPYLSEMEQ